MIAIECNNREMTMGPETVAKFSEVDRRLDALHDGLDENTKITLLLSRKQDDASRKQDELSAKQDDTHDELTRIGRNTQPVVDAIEAMQPGIKVMGQIGDASAWVLTKIKMFGLPIMAVAAFVYAVLHGDGVTAAIAAFFKAMSGK